MAQRAFPFKQEELPVIGEFLIQSAKNDLADFSGFSPVFTPAYLTAIENKITACKELISSSVVTKELKAATAQLGATAKGLRVKLNALDGYLKLAAKDLDVAVADMGIKAVRNAINKGNAEGIPTNVQKLLAAVRRNQAKLTAKGLKPELLADIETQANEVDTLNSRQNELISARNRLTDENIQIFNELWQVLHPILETAQALYRGVDDVKLKDYTVAQLVKRIDTEGKRKRKTDSSE